MLAFGAGAPISVVSFELAEEGIAVGSLGWTAVGLAGGALAYWASDGVIAFTDGFAAGALLAMLIDSMIPEARKGAGRVAGLATTLGLAVAAALSSLSWPGSNRWIRA